MKALRIIKYNERHEDAASRRVKRLNYCQAPVTQNSRGWKKLKMRGEFHALGVYTVLFEFAATLPIRGVFADAEQPYTTDDIAIYTDMPMDHLQRGLEVLMHESVGWVDWIEWPIDPRLIQVNEYREQVTSRIILPWSVDQDGSVFDQAGNLIDPASPVFMGESIKTAFGSRQQPPRMARNGLKTQRNRNRRKTEQEPKPETEEKPAEILSSGSSDSDSGDAARTKALQIWRLKVSRLFASRGTAQHQADDTSASRLFHDHLWPDDLSAAEAHRRIEQAAALIPEAAKRRTPMAWLTHRITTLDGKAAV